MCCSVASWPPSSVCAVYVIVVFVASAVLTDVFVDWWPDRVVVPALCWPPRVAVIAALALAGSVVLSTTANGIAVFMLFGAGLVAGLLGQIAEALSSDTLERVSTIASWFLPFEALYQTALQADHRRDVRLHALRHRPRPVRRRADLRAVVGAVHGRLPRPHLARPRCGPSAGATSELGSVQPMIAVENITDWRGQDVVDPVGEKLGKLEQVYFDGETDDATFIAVKSGTFSKNLTLVPLAKATVGRDYVRVDHAKSAFKKAPSYDTDVELTLDDEAETFKYYGLEYTPAGEGARRLAKR